MNLSTIRTKYCCSIIILLCIIYIGLPLQSTAATFSESPNLEVLNAKVDILQKTNDKILNSVYWTLGILSAIFLGLVSVNLYFNISANKRDFKDHKREIENLVRNLIKTAEQEIDEKTNNVIQKEIGRFKDEISNITISAIKTSEASLIEKTNELTQKEIEKSSTNIFNIAKNEILTSKAEIIKLLDDSNKRIDNIISSSTKKTANDLMELQITVRELQVYKYSQEGKRGAMIGLLDILDYDLEHRKWNLNNSLSKILERTKKKLVHIEDANRLKILLKKIEDEKFKEIVKEILDSIKIQEPDKA